MNVIRRQREPSRSYRRGVLGAVTLAAGLAGGNLVYEAAGMFASLLGASFEGFVIDNENGAVGRDVTDNILNCYRLVIRY